MQKSGFKENYVIWKEYLKSNVSFLKMVHQMWTATTLDQEKM